MNTWTPLMDSIVDSSLWTEPYFVRVLFVTMMALKDKDFIVRRSAFAIAQRAHMTEAEVLKGLKILSSPDKRRLEPQAWDGRRLQKVEEGWLILNGRKYREIIGAQKRREYKAGKAREYYWNGKGKPQSGEILYKRGVEDGTIDPAPGEPA